MSPEPSEWVTDLPHASSPEKGMRWTAVSLFSGIGGFELAAEANGIEILCQVEIDERCRRFLHSHWPDIPQYGDIRDFPAEQYRGATLVMGGPPCQPVSLAGKLRGKEDDRWLWGEALRVVDEAKPRWCLLENSAGLFDVGFDGILADLEEQGYETGTVVLPACAVNSPQIRARVWIVAHASEERREGSEWSRPFREQGPTSPRTTPECLKSDMAHCERSGRRTDEQGERPQGRDADGRYREGDLAHSEQQRHEPLTGSMGEGKGTSRCKGSQSTAITKCDVQGYLADTRCGNSEQRRANPDEQEERAGAWSIDQGLSPWSEFVWVPCADGKLRRAPGNTQRMAYGLPVELLEELGTEGRQTPKDCEVHRSILAALGNSIVWPVAAEIIRAIVKASEEIA